MVATVFTKKKIFEYRTWASNIQASPTENVLIGYEK